MLRALKRLLVAFMAPLERTPRLVFAVACALLVCMYCTNHDMGGDPAGVRGDGKYRPVLARGDGHMMYLMARSTALDGDWIFDNDLARFGDPWNEPRTTTGRKAIVHPIGPALVWTPLIWVAEAGAVIANAFGAKIPLHGYTLWHQRFVFLSSVLFACAAAFLGLRLAKRLVGGNWAATYAAIAILLGTSLTYYATYMPSYGHAMDAFACSAFLAYWGRSYGRTDLRRWLTLGALLGIAALIRIQEIAFGVVVVVELLAHVVQAIRQDDEPVLVVARRWMFGGALTLVLAIIVLVPQFIEWHVVFGKVTELPQGSRFTRLNAPMIPELLFAPRNGWLSSTPIAYAGCVGLFLVPRRFRAIGVALIVCVGVQVYLNSGVLDWWSSASFGQRRMCNVTLPLIVGLACLIRRCADARFLRWMPKLGGHAVAVFVLGVFVHWNIKAVGRLDSGKAAPQELVPTCCWKVWTPLRPTAWWIYDRIGNPFEFPANLVFALEHDVPLTRWDQIVGNYPLQPTLADLKDDNRFYATSGGWTIGSRDLEPYLVDGWSGSMKADGRPFRYTIAARATVLVPNLMPNSQRATLWVAAAGSRHVSVVWNGRDVANASVDDAWTPITFDLRPMELHTNELTIVTELGPSTFRVGWPAMPFRTGVAVSNLSLQLLRD
jgi:hypothetical protein